MLGVLSDYVKSVVVVSIIISAAMSVAPKGAARSVVGAVSGLIMITLLLRPLTALKGVDFSGFSFTPENNAVSVEEKLTAERDNLLKELIVEKTSAYILAKAQALDVDCEVIITLDGGAPPLPATAVIKASIPYDPIFQREMSVFLAFDCGIPKENQSFLWDQEQQ